MKDQKKENKKSDSQWPILKIFYRGEIMSKSSWYGARCIFQHLDKPLVKKSKKYLYEERVLLVKADSFDKAIEKAELEAKAYVKFEKKMQYTGFIDIFQIYSKKIVDSTEVFSLMRSSNLSLNKYLNRFFDTGYEHTRKE